MNANATMKSLTSSARRKAKAKKKWSISKSTRKLIGYLAIRLIFLVVRALLDRN